MIKQLLEGVIGQNEILHEFNANITYISLPRYIYGFVFNHKCINNIFINKSLNDYKKRNTILHEFAHIELNHLNQGNKDIIEFYIEKYEDEADRYIENIKTELGLQ